MCSGYCHGHLIFLDGDDYPLQNEIEEHIGKTAIKVSIASDRTCYILGEAWKDNAKGCSDAIFIAVGTGIGIGILTDGRILHGHNDIVGATGWMALQRPFQEEYKTYGCFESRASATGIALQVHKLLKSDSPIYKDSVLRKKIWMLLPLTMCLRHTIRKTL